MSQEQSQHASSEKRHSWVSIHQPDESNWCVCDACINTDAALNWHEYSSKWEYDESTKRQLREYLVMANLPRHTGMAKLTQLFRNMARPLVDSSRFTISPNGLRTKNGALILGDNAPDKARGQCDTIDSGVPFGSRPIWLDSQTKCHIPASFFVLYLDDIVTPPTPSSDCAALNAICLRFEEEQYSILRPS